MAFSGNYGYGSGLDELVPLLEGEPAPYFLEGGPATGLLEEGAAGPAPYFLEEDHFGQFQSAVEDPAVTYAYKQAYQQLDIPMPDLFQKLY